MASLSEISVVLPSLDPDEKLRGVIDGLLAQGFTDIILVNDGSKEENLHYFEEAARDSRVQLLHHEANKGKGAALKTAFRWFLENRPEGRGVVTVDGDGQHHPEDTKACALNTLETGKITLGVRDFSGKDVPARSRFGNNLTSLIFKVFVGMKIADTQTGLRAFSREAVEELTEVAGDRFEYETNMLLFMKQEKMAFDQVQIRTVYIEENKTSHFHPIRDSFRIYKLIFGHFVKYGISAVISAIIDGGLVWLFNVLLHKTLAGLVLTAVVTASARTISSVCNFFMNKKLVFKDRSNTLKAMGKYYMVAIPNMLLQIFMNEVGYRLLGISGQQSFLRLVIHYAMMAVLFIATYALQKRWVFASKKKETRKEN